MVAGPLVDRGGRRDVCCGLPSVWRGPDRRPDRWSIGDRLSFAINQYQATALGAFNLWMIPIGREVAPLDSQFLTAGLTYREVGIALMGVSFALCLDRCGTHCRSSVRTDLVVGGLHLRLLRCSRRRAHERYLFPALALPFCWCSLEIRAWWIPAMLSLTLVVSIGSSLAWGWMPGGTTLGFRAIRLCERCRWGEYAVFVGVIRIG